MYTRSPEILAGDGYVYYFDCGDDVTGVHTCPNSSSDLHSIGGFFIVYQLQFNKLAGGKKDSIDHLTY